MLSVHAYAFASTLSPKELATLLLGGAVESRTTKTQIVARYGESSWIVGYDFGALVFVGVDNEKRDAVMRTLLQRVPAEPHPPMHEGYQIETSAAEAPCVKFDRIVARQTSQQLVELVALVLAQSAAMEYYEEDVDKLLEQLNAIAEDLAKRGRFNVKIRDLLRFIGGGMSTRNQVVYTLALLDTPQLAWVDEELDKLYRGLRAQFEIEDRYRALDHKLTIVRDNFELLVDLTKGQRSWVVEIAVAVLVGIEVILFVYELFVRR